MSLVGIKVGEMGDGAKGKCRRWSSRVVSGWKVYIRYICVCVCVWSPIANHVDSEIRGGKKKRKRKRKEKKSQLSPDSYILSS